MTDPTFEPQLETEVRAELRGIESSDLDEVLREPVTTWRFDPTEIPRFEAVLRSLLGAVEAGEQPVDPPSE